MCCNRPEAVCATGDQTPAHALALGKSDHLLHTLGALSPNGQAKRSNASSKTYMHTWPAYWPDVGSSSRMLHAHPYAQWALPPDGQTHALNCQLHKVLVGMAVSHESAVGAVPGMLRSALARPGIGAAARS